MIKKSLKSAIWVALGVTFGSVILPRLMSPQLYNETYPSLLLQAFAGFCAGYVASFLVYLLIEYVKSKKKKES